MKPPDLDRLRQEAARAVVAERALSERMKRLAGPTSSGALTLGDLAAAMERLGPPAPTRWLVRRAGLSADEERQVYRLRLPERFRPSLFLPPNAIAVVFEERPGEIFPVGMTVIKAEGS